MRSAACLVVVLSLAACNRSAPPSAEAPTSSSLSATTATSATSGVAEGRAEVGKPAPDFALKDLDGKTWSLHELRGKTVVLEWFNPECPFVRMSHTKGSLVGTAKRHTDLGVVWLAINSSAAGKQGNGLEKNLEGKKRYDLSHPILLDASGEVGRSFGATNTPLRGRACRNPSSINCR